MTERAQKDDPWTMALKAMKTSVLKTSAFEKAWAQWAADKIERRQRLTQGAVTLQIHKLEKAGLPSALAAIETSIDRGWRSVFPETECDVDNEVARRIDAANRRR